MELRCPECLGLLETQDGQSARCTVHGGEYRILFSRWQPPPPPVMETAAAAMPPVMLVADATCAFHQTVPAAYACAGCGTPICATCDFEQNDGTHLCLTCAKNRVTFAPPAPATEAAPPAGARCVQHAHVQATRQCKSCGAFVCSTCAFELPGRIFLCPACATTPKTALSPKRRNLLIGAFGLAAWCSVGLAVLLSGALAGALRTKADQEMFGIVFTLLVLIPSLVGLALAFSARDRRLANPPAIWIAIVWNCLLAGGFLLLCIIGAFS